jgi:hypothetical protein
MAWDPQDNASFGEPYYPWCSCYEYLHEQQYPEYYDGELE